MPNYQNTGLTQAGTLLQGGWKMEVAASAGNLVASGTNIGLGNLTSVLENIEPFSVQAGNGPDPLEGIAEHTATINFETIEFYPSTWDQIRGGNFDTEVTSTAGTYVSGTANTFSTGGFTELTPVALRFTNTKLVSGASVATVIVLYKCTITQGISWTAKSDNDEDPVTIVPFVIEAKPDTLRTVGDQLYIIETQMGA